MIKPHFLHIHDNRIVSQKRYLFHFDFDYHHQREWRGQWHPKSHNIPILQRIDGRQGDRTALERLFDEAIVMLLLASERIRLVEAIRHTPVPDNADPSQPQSQFEVVD